MGSVTELISGNSSSECHHPHQHFPLRAPPDTRGRCREDYDKGTSTFSIISSRWNSQTAFAQPLHLVSEVVSRLCFIFLRSCSFCFCWKCLLKKPASFLPCAWEFWPCVQGPPVLMMPFLGCPEILLELLWEQYGKAPAFYDNVAQLSVALNKSLKQILSKVPPVIKSLI